MAFHLIGDVAPEACSPAAVVWINVDQVGSHTLQSKEFSTTKGYHHAFDQNYMEQYLMIIIIVTFHCLAQMLLFCFQRLWRFWMWCLDLKLCACRERHVCAGSDIWSSSSVGTCVPSAGCLLFDLAGKLFLQHLRWFRSCEPMGSENTDGPCLSRPGTDPALHVSKHELVYHGKGRNVIV